MNATKRHGHIILGVSILHRSTEVDSNLMVTFAPEFLKNAGLDIKFCNILDSEDSENKIALFWGTESWNIVGA